MRAIVTVIGKDKVGIIAEICTLLSKMSINILDINQTVMQEFFTMNMLVDTKLSNDTFENISKALSCKGNAMGLSVRIQREDIFTAMHKI